MADGALTRPLLCCVSDGSLRGRESIEEAARRLREAADAGADLIHVREKAVDDATLLAFVRRVMDVTSALPARVVVNDRLDVAIAAGAAGVHLRGDSFSAADARRIAPRDFLIGRSVHSVEEAVAVERGGGCNYLVFGTVYPTASKPAGHAVAGIEALAAVCRAVRLPVLAIGGVTAERAAEIARAGAAGIAAIGLFGGTGQDTVHQDIVQQVRRAWS